MYKIEYTYSTGNSFGRAPDVTDQIELEWNNLEVAKQNLQRIKEHHDFNQKIESYLARANRLEIIEAHRSKDWFVEERGDYYRIKLYTDDNKPYQMWPNWMGYFESLLSIEIIKPMDEELRIEF